MPTSAILLALLSGVSAATWTICLKLGSAKINAALGAMVITEALKRAKLAPEQVDEVIMGQVLTAGSG